MFDDVPLSEDNLSRNIQQNVLSVSSSSTSVVLPMLAKPLLKNQLTKVFNKQTPDEWIYEEKYDGERMLAMITNTNKMPIYLSRTLKPLHIFGHKITLKSGFENCIVDGEVVYWDTNEQRIISICDTGNDRITQTRYALRYLIFDVQLVNGQSVLHLELLKRKELLESIIQESDNVFLSKFHNFKTVDELLATFHQVCQRSGEGLMLKLRKQMYISNKRRWYKLKPLHFDGLQEDFEVYARRMLKDRNGLWSILECGYFKDKQTEFSNFIKLCNVSSGIDGRNRTVMTMLLDENTGVFKRPIIVTLKADKVTIHGHLRHPTFLRIRHDMDTLPFNSKIMKHNK